MATWRRTEERARLEDLNASGAKILFVAKGVPDQECWIAENAARLAAAVVLGVGALFDFYSGAVTRAPRLVRDLRMRVALPADARAAPAVAPLPARQSRIHCPGAALALVAATRSRGATEAMT